VHYCSSFAASLPAVEGEGEHFGYGKVSLITLTRCLPCTLPQLPLGKGGNTSCVSQAVAPTYFHIHAIRIQLCHIEFIDVPLFGLPSSDLHILPPDSLFPFLCCCCRCCHLPRATAASGLSHAKAQEEVQRQQRPPHAPYGFRHPSHHGRAFQTSFSLGDKRRRQ
jgi:hypothetical protein